MARNTTEAQDNRQVMEVVDSFTQEPTSEVAPKTRTRKPRESATDKAISDIRELLNLKLKLQKEQEQVALIKPSIEKLLTSVDITE
ncbi:MAG: hypothetical protein H7Y22_02865 [Gemmatimonadaceae bacterium]|nr:hypothetical protein [Gloeobacterales cyanobacterium ES-bin-141]